MHPQAGRGLRSGARCPQTRLPSAIFWYLGASGKSKGQEELRTGENSNAECKQE